MAQIRFQIGVGGSAARNAESARERFRPVRPEAGSAARQAEEQRRAEEAGGGKPYPRMATVRVQSRSGQTTDAPSGPDRQAKRAIVARNCEETSQSLAAHAPYPEDAPSPSGNTGAAQFGSDAPVSVLPELNPLQTAAAKVRSLFRSVFSRAEGENQTVHPKK